MTEQTPAERLRAARRTIIVETDETDGGFIASILEVPGCASQGGSLRAAVLSVLDALAEMPHESTVCICDSRGPCLGVPPEIDADGEGRFDCGLCLSLGPDRNCLAFDGLALAATEEER